MSAKAQIKLPSQGLVRGETGNYPIKNDAYKPTTKGSSALAVDDGCGEKLFLNLGWKCNHVAMNNCFFKPREKGAYVRTEREN